MEKQDTKTDIQELEKKLKYTPTHVWDSIDDDEKKRAFAFAEVYKDFLDQAKTEREAVRYISEKALAAGFTYPGTSNPPSSAIVMNMYGKTVSMARLGTEPISEGVRIIISHIDAPRLDLKQRPLMEKEDMAFLKTHYYGGIKKFQWLTRPLSLHGCIIKSDGSALNVEIGEREDDPVFTILDLLPHLARKAQYEKKLLDAIEGEKLNIVVGSLPFENKDVSDRFKLSVLLYLDQKYGVREEDLISSEIEVVPAGRARDVGLDRGLVGGYGQDDRICAFSSMNALLDAKGLKKTGILLFADKEEIGSDGATGAKSRFIEQVVAELMKTAGLTPTAFQINSILSRSQALSADVNAGIDPDYTDVHEKQNAACTGYGLCMTKFTGHGGKYAANDANAEYVGWLRQVFNRQKVVWQTGELGKVDEGGGGTVAKFLASYGMNIVDCGPPILSMHSPFEISHKGDLYMAYKGYRAFLEE